MVPLWRQEVIKTILRDENQWVINLFLEKKFIYPVRTRF